MAVRMVSKYRKFMFGIEDAIDAATAPICVIMLVVLGSAFAYIVVNAVLEMIKRW